MRVYRVGKDGFGERYFGDRKAAQEHARLIVPREDVVVRLIEASVDKDSILKYLNGEEFDYAVLKTWTLTARGSLIGDEDEG
jgi:hypothetical protein